MNKLTGLWLAIGLIYLSFFSWYTSFGGPLTDEEIDHYLNIMIEGGADEEQLTRMRRFMEEDTGDDFVMINVIDMYETPLQIEGVEPGETSDQVLDKYMQYMYPELFKRASHPVLVGTAAANAMDIMNADGMHHWTRGAGMRYRSRRDVLDISLNQEFQGAHEFKVAAMAKTIAFPVDPWFQLGDPRLILALLLGFIGCAASWLLVARRAPAEQQAVPAAT